MVLHSSTEPLYLDTRLPGAAQVSREDAIIVERAHARMTFP